MLPNGKVLIAGGFDPSIGGEFASAELYDPASGQFSYTGSMSIARTMHVACPLPGGRVLVAGGASSQDPQGYTASAEVYDPATGEFASTGNMSIARIYFSCTSLRDGSVLVAGSSDGNTNFFASAERYDPVTGQFASTGNLTGPISPSTVAALVDGRVLFAGGNTPAGYTSDAELYDPASGAFSATAALNVPQSAAKAILLTAGGYPDVSDAELHDPSAQQFIATGSLIEGRSDFTATALSNGRVLVAGGQGASGVLASAEIFTPDKVFRAGFE